MTIGYLALGSNIGDRLATLKKAVRLLSKSEKVTVLKKSFIYETEPYGGVAQDNFLNAVLKIETNLSPLELLDLTQGVENSLGRERLVRWGPRTIDIDLLLLGTEEITSEKLTIPHIELKKRSFVLIPLKDVYEEETLFNETLGELIETTGNKMDVWKSKESW
ncbi:2-amino-4-hydroxy-6-hydroxymethyldihydropteridine diphosphokinase [Vagococcus carniphilus]|uniref:2-amino-4-hydroxy-6-hydroxymethyldihydropteridine diphosphokinase n=1 Tax=Vagococcus carniphilus TaxID=218144 RepID=A0AAW8U1L6_9ENTE|nr:2-amino-4-hydroxy-6-hydroxymethyldihydropteridine diphosphokinase [Vagococcus carniphilus]MDT2829360.1 2-amino-4-hydroxy-6-hydroxymethyldihydropteridine diphosphokinase [Vagococcus carniphilus]MDT2833433.1 2-amino-4-hydroxy-6-hydroxymethyldihydropteridine diphosphokinase [Vagococcus carniphilus]MDT2838819.1 2-amino-4-hydroxy-6-hydroxymethyldihydropteridine diphosphokinase [Vagococcus carniphilus]MDT2852877.1 2-amino-4-hydroxy-6-hydroxymethyldihydropteridine diphosphokinase [Vagococcus carnip